MAASASLTAWVTASASASGVSAKNRWSTAQPVSGEEGAGEVEAVSLMPTAYGGALRVQAAAAGAGPAAANDPAG